MTVLLTAAARIVCASISNVSSTLCLLKQPLSPRRRYTVKARELLRPAKVNDQLPMDRKEFNSTVLMDNRLDR